MSNRHRSTDFMNDVTLEDVASTTSGSIYPIIITTKYACHFPRRMLFIEFVNWKKYVFPYIWTNLIENINLHQWTIYKSTFPLFKHTRTRLRIVFQHDILKDNKTYLVWRIISFNRTCTFHLVYFRYFTSYLLLLSLRGV